MRTIIAGSRDLLGDNLEHVRRACFYAQFGVTVVISGTCRGIDKAGECWALQNGLLIEQYPADWKNITRPGAVIRYDKYGRPYDAAAGNFRNKQMSQVADALIAVWDGKSPGTRDMVAIMKAAGKRVYVHLVN